LLSDAVSTGGVVYNPRPGETVRGVLGTTNYSVFMKALRAGKENITLEVRFSHGPRKQIPFTLKISRNSSSV